MSEAPRIPTDFSRTVPVHKQDAEGVLIINAETGLVQQPIEERPEWADGLLCGLLTERYTFYSERLGLKYADEHREPEAFNMEDLGWIIADETTGEEREMEASHEFRQNVLAEVLGMDQRVSDGADLPGHIEGSTVLAEASFDTHRTNEQAKALEDAQGEGFPAVADGTNG